MNREQIIAEIRGGQAIVGIEFGSTRIKAVLITSDNVPAAEGGYEWENQLIDGVWTYPLEAVTTGLQACYADLLANVQASYGVTITSLQAIGISAMMHGYLAFDREGNLLVPFRTWRNTMTAEAAAELTDLFQYNIPQRWSIAHLYQAILNEEPHVQSIDHITTLSAYVHELLTGERVIGVDDASGMFPIDMATHDYDARMVGQFNALIADRGLGWTLLDVLPRCLVAGEDAGHLTAAGAALLDVSGQLQAGIPLCPPEGDAGTGMTATNAVAQRTGNVSAGTSVFGMVVLERGLSRVYPEIDLVTTPAGDLVAMAHCNNGTSDLNAWVNVIGEAMEAMGTPVNKTDLFTTLYTKALEGAPDGAGLVAYNYDAGEPITGLAEGRPLFLRQPGTPLHLADFMRVHLYSSIAVLKVGMDLLADEGVVVDNMMGHGGLFKTKGVAQRFLAAALETPVTCMTTAGEGGAWGIALLAAYLVRGQGQTLDTWLNTNVFATAEGETIQPDPVDVAGFQSYMVRYKAGLAAEKSAVESITY